MTLPEPCPGLNDVDYYMVGISKLPGFDRVIKLSSNESPLGPSPKAIAAASRAMAEAHRYPEVETEALRSALAETFGLEAARITFGAGSDELLTRLVNTYCGNGDEVIHSEHAYMQFPIYAKTAGAKPVAARDDDFRHSVDNILACVTPRTKAVIVANPDNPSGTYLPGSEIRRLADGLPKDVLLIIDAAYDEYAWAEDFESATKLVEERENVVTTRTFSKVFGLAGLRLGWCYAAPSIVDLLERIGPSFPVNSAAREAALAALADQAHTQSVLDHNRRVGGQFAADLSALGLKVYPSQTNFVLVAFPTEESHSATAADRVLQENGIIARRFAVDDFKDKLRFTIGLEPEMQKTVAVLRDFLAG